MKKVKRIKRLLSLISMLLLSATLLSGCTGAGQPANPATQAKTEPTTELPTEPCTLTIGGVDVSNYRIVYGMNAEKKTFLTTHRDKMEIFWEDALDAELQTANRLAKILKDKLGVSLPVVEDFESSPSEYEILIGLTDRQESETAASTKTLGIDDYEIKL